MPRGLRAGTGRGGGRALAPRPPLRTYNDPPASAAWQTPAAVYICRSCRGRPAFYDRAKYELHQEREHAPAPSGRPVGAKEAASAVLPVRAGTLRITRGHARSDLDPAVPHTARAVPARAVSTRRR
mgnify:CR=1 FL=1